MSISSALSRFAHNVRFEEIPAPVARRAKLLMLDAIGIGFASSQYEFARKAFDGVSRFGSGASVVIGFDRALPLRDAVLMNGILVHGLDYDDTYLPGAVHMTASGVPCTLGMAAEAGASGRDWLTAFVVGLEVSARVGRGGNGGFQKAGFHPTSICGTMGASVAAARLMKLDEDAMRRAQGIALSTASGSMQPVQDGTWTKRMHPGWAAAAGISAAGLAAGGFTGPDAAYEGRFGLYNLFLGTHASKADPSLVTQDLGVAWEFARSSVKLYPACHQSHAFMNAALKIAHEHDVKAADIERIDTLVAEMTRDLVCEPAEAKRRPDSSYLAQFSLPYAMAACFTRRRFGLGEIDDASYTDPSMIGLAQKVHYSIDPDAGFPKTRTGEVIVTLRDGAKLRQREEIKPDEPASEEAIVAKFMANADMVMDRARAEAIAERILTLEAQPRAEEVARALAA
ncbi:MAG TPA: MmgE/PrpD family protein [Burkholderiales bacterium]|nr:MmgE/PrpD family protein [Burkholderiales bacterium]